jgi:hypothetical protein
MTMAASMIPCLVSAGFAGRSRRLRGSGVLSVGLTGTPYHDHGRNDHGRDTAAEVQPLSGIEDLVLAERLP